MNESADETLNRVDAIADLVMSPCPHCNAERKVEAVRPGGFVVMGETHEPGCPSHVDA